MAVPTRYPLSPDCPASGVVSPSQVMLTVSPPVSPSVVATILIIQNPSVIAGTLLSKTSRSVMGLLPQPEAYPQSPRRPPLNRSVAANPRHDQRIGDILRARRQLQSPCQGPGRECVKRGRVL